MVATQSTRRPTIGSLAALRIAGGLLLALAPLLAGLLLFDADTRACSQAGCVASP